MKSHYRGFKNVYLYALFITLPIVALAQEPDSLKVLERMVQASPGDREIWVRLGYAYLDAGDLDRADKAFRKGIQGATASRAFNGLGLVYTRRSKQPEKALFYFRRALGADPTFFEVRMNIARLYLKMGNFDAGKALEEVIQADSTYAPAYLALGNWYADWFEGWDANSDEQQRRIELFKRYILLRPEDSEGPYRLALTYIEQQHYVQALDVAEPAMELHPDEARLLPLAAQAYATQGEADQALGLFRIFFWMLPDSNRTLYEDLSLVAFPEELAAYRSLSEAEQEAFLDQFWLKRDPTLISAGRARRVEHYRRVWYARTYFADKVQPWDKRGEVYIRYGAPDYRSRSDRFNPPPSVAVQVVKERNAFTIYREKESEALPIPGEIAHGGALIEPVFPLDRSSASEKIDDIYVAMEPKVHWESWVYTQVGGGIELVFTDQMLNGQWAFAPLPLSVALPLDLIARLTELNPANVLQVVSSAMPERYTLPPGIEPLTFYYDLATFRGKAENTEVEVYYGIAPEQMAVQEVGQLAQIQVERTVVFTDRTGEVAHRTVEALPVAWAASSPLNQDTFLPDVAKLEVPSGTYRVAVQLIDQVSGKWGIYQQAVTVPAYRDSLGISDLELAWSISETPQGQKFQKGNVWVIPMPSRSYRDDQGVYVYYEIYNLQKDRFGQTRYRVSYAIRQDSRTRLGVFGAVFSGFRRLLSAGKPEVVVSYDRTGSEAFERIYFELETENLDLGVHQVEVRVTDMNGGGTVSKSVVFVLGKGE